MPPIKTGKQTFSSSIEDATNYSNWIVNTFARYYGNSCMEVGFGHGGYRPYLPDHIEYVGLDIDAEVVSKARQREPGTLFVEADIAQDDLSARLGDTRLDSILCANVLEHVPDHQQAVRNLLSVLSPGGHLLLFVPAFEGLFNDMDRLAGHLRRYTRASMVQVLPKHGVEVIRTAYFNPIGGIGWWVNRLMRHDNIDSTGINRQVEVFDRYILPISKGINPLTQRFFGQSLICIVKKK